MMGKEYAEAEIDKLQALYTNFLGERHGSRQQSLAAPTAAAARQTLESSSWPRSHMPAPKGWLAPLVCRLSTHLRDTATNAPALCPMLASKRRPASASSPRNGPFPKHPASPLPNPCQAACSSSRRCVQ